ncbi:hypothetical protein PEL8287_03705 [Roseovarius litorisediminis]|uniref:Uncharacterized protein n=1 Tax=Roseovarius litorisediminis TaxID=1312363 RepID=A0A1Y5TLI2_9RHOB|nr:hypothetical protein [Roseovarius litorisediminis]SLN66760.1 hypothetical protein PEL8287_03705 [Roseovarius litorisediminis]
MGEIRDGFFYHPDGESPEQQIQRLLTGEHNPAFDDLFSTTIQEADSEIREAERDRKKLLSQLVALRNKLLSLRANRDEIKQAVQTFDETGEIAPVLVPACEAMAAKEQAALRAADTPTKADEIAKAKAALAAKLPDGWAVDETKADDEFVYVTLKCRRAVVAPERPSREETRTRIIERVREAFETYRLDFSNRIRPLRPVTVRPSPRASP